VVLKDRIKVIEEEMERENGVLSVVEREDARLAKNEVVAGDQGLSIQQLQSINEYLRGRQEALAYKRIEIRRKIAILNEQLGKLKLQLAQVQGKKTRPTSEVVVEVSANAAVSATLTLKYMVSSAGWSPTYDIRVADITKPMQLTYKAQVYQSTGEDWDKVQLALSSGEPNKDAIMPTLYPWRLDFGRPRPAPVANVQQGYNANVRERDLDGCERPGHQRHHEQCGWLLCHRGAGERTHAAHRLHRLQFATVGHFIGDDECEHGGECAAVERGGGAVVEIPNERVWCSVVRNKTSS
jgi:uncharacterized protein (TIGR02231 family)